MCCGIVGGCDSATSLAGAVDELISQNKRQEAEKLLDVRAGHGVVCTTTSTFRVLHSTHPWLEGKPLFKPQELSVTFNGSSPNRLQVDIFMLKLLCHSILFIFILNVCPTQIAGRMVGVRVSLESLDCENVTVDVLRALFPDAQSSTSRL